MRTITKSYEVYTAEELQEQHPSGFDKAYQNFCANIYHELLACAALTASGIDVITSELYTWA